LFSSYKQPVRDTQTDGRTGKTRNAAYYDGRITEVILLNLTKRENKLHNNMNEKVKCRRRKLSSMDNYVIVLLSIQISRWAKTLRINAMLMSHTVVYNVL